MDFNGVIINDEPIQMRAYQEILGTEGIVLTEEDYYSCLGMDDITFIKAAYARDSKAPPDGKVEEIRLAKSAKWREIVSQDGIPIFPGVENFIRKCAKEFAVGIVSMARRDEIEYVLDSTGLRNCFPVIVSAEDVDSHKPDPACYLKGFGLIDSYRVRREHLPMVHGECLVVEDSPPGVVAGKRAGMWTLGVTNTVSEDAMREVGVDAVAKNISDWMPDSIHRVFA